MAVINKTPNKYKIVEIGIRINMLESFHKLNWHCN